MISLREFPKIEDHVQYYFLFLVGICTAVVSLSRLINSWKLEVNVPLEGSSGSPHRTLAHMTLSQTPNPYSSELMIGPNAQYGKETFKIPQLNQYIVIINKRENIEDIRKAPDNKASFDEAVAEDFQFRWTFGEKLSRDTYHLVPIRNQLTRSLVFLFDGICDEIMCAFNDLIPMKSDDWVAIPALDTIRNVVCRASNRIFVGVPLCRDPDYIDISINFTIDVMKTVYMIDNTPVLLRPLVGACFSPTARTIHRAMKHLRPVFEERFRMYDENGGDWSGKPVDMISWLIDEAPNNRDIRDLVMRMLHINFAAIHTSSNSFTHALFHLAAEPQYIGPIREEVEQVIKEEGWSKAAMTKMWKLDSFMKESQRFNGILLLSLSRKIMSDFTLSDGTFLPAGTFIAANLTGAHCDDTLYPDADKFDGFRFSKLREKNSEESVKHQMVNTSPEYLAFGHGRHACPGRFFAVNELKAMMAYLISNYDVKAEVEGVRPENEYHRTQLTPNSKTKVLLKKRTDV